MASQSKRCKASSSAGIKPDPVSNIKKVSLSKKFDASLSATIKPHRVDNIKEEGQTIVLSNARRESSTSIPELEIRDCNSHGNRDALVKLIGTSLPPHNGPIYKFKIDSKATSSDAFDRWIWNLSRNGIKQLELNFRTRDNPIFYISKEKDIPRFKIHSSFFSCDALTSVLLRTCCLKLPSRFKGFRFLHTFEITRVEISGNCINKLISCCPALEKLTLFYEGNCNDLEIQAPNLKALNIRGEFTSLNIHAPMLLTLSIDLMNLSVENQSCRTNLEQALACMHNLEELAMLSYFVQFLVKGQHVRNFPLTFQNMTDLSFCLDIEDEEHGAFLISLLHNNPQHRSLYIEMRLNGGNRPKTPHYFWKSVDAKDFSLLWVSIASFVVVENAMSFVKLLFGSSPQLEELHIYEEECFCTVDMDSHTAKCVKKIMTFPRVSRKARVVIR